MNHDPEKIRIIGRWLADLVDMTKSGREPLTDRKMVIYTEQLADIFPSGAFTPGSLRAVVFEQEYFPAFDVVRARVRQWWNDNKPAAGALIGFEGGPRLDEMDQSWLTRYYKRRGELVQINAHQSQLDNLDSLVKQESPRAWLSITGQRDTRHEDATEAEKEAVAAAVRRVTEGVS